MRAHGRCTALAPIMLAACLGLTACGGGSSSPQANRAPVAEAGPNGSIAGSMTYTLDGGGSSDGDGTIASYQWSQIAGPAVAVADVGQPRASFDAPELSVDTALTFRLTVTDDDGASATDSVSVTVLSNRAPVADAGPDDAVTEGMTYTLDGGGSSDGDGTIASYQWSQVPGPTVAIDDLGQLRASFDAPAVAADTNLLFRLSVTDDDGASATDIVVITVQPAVFSLTGTVTAAQGTAVDGDVNDPNAALVPNNDAQSAQAIPNPITVGGYVNRPGVGPNGALHATGDVSDFYRVQLIEGQTITLLVGDPVIGDPDLYLLNAAGDTTIDASLGPGDVESLVVPASGEYLVEVLAASGATTYVLVIGNTQTAGAGAGFRLSDDFVPGEIVMRYASAVSAANGQAALKASAASSLGLEAAGGAPDRSMLMRLGTQYDRAVLQAKSGASAADPRTGFADDRQRLKHDTLTAIKLLNGDSSVLYAEPNYVKRALAVPNDEYYPLQWHYPLISLPAAWDTTTGDPGVTVGVIDTGVLLNHPDLQGQLVAGYDFISSPSISGDDDGIDADPSDPGDGGGGQQSSFHGTHVAGTIAASSNNGQGVAGIAWNAKVMPLRALGVGGGTDYDIIQAIRYAAGLSNDSGTAASPPVDVINLSLGGFGPCGSAFQNVFDQARAAGVTVVVAAGNSNTDAATTAPANCDNVITVSAVGMDKHKAPYSNFGERIDVAAPGGDMSQDLNGDGYGDGVLSTLGQDSSGSIVLGYGFYQGTSMASPHVAGVAALMRSVNPALTPAQIDQMLLAGDLTDNIGDPSRYGHGLINAQKAVFAALDAIGMPPAENPTLDVTPRSLNFGSVSTTASLTVRNTGGGSLNAQTPVRTQPWLTIAATDVSADNLGVYSIDVDRTGLADGVYADTITVQSDINTIEVPVIMQVSGAGIASDAGVLYVLLVDFETNDVVTGVGVTGRDGAYDFELADVPDGVYWIVAGSDDDNDNFICDAGEVCGAYLTRAEPEELVLDRDLGGLDFSAGHQIAIPSQMAATSGQPAGYRRPAIQNGKEPSPKQPSPKRPSQ